MVYAETTKAEEIDEWSSKITQTVAPLQTKIESLEANMHENTKEVKKQVK